MKTQPCKDCGTPTRYLRCRPCFNERIRRTAWLNRNDSPQPREQDFLKREADRRAGLPER